jgi:hypothetical protein
MTNERLEFLFNSIEVFLAYKVDAFHHRAQAEKQEKARAALQELRQELILEEK